MKLILLVTGHPNTAKQVRRVLHTDYSVLTATGEESAIEFARSVLIDVVIIDVNPPYQRLERLTKRLTELQEDVVIAAFVPQEIQEREEEEYLAGLYDYIKKPLSGVEISYLVARALEKQAFVQERKLLRASLDRMSSVSPARRRKERDSQIYDGVLRDFSKALSASFDIHKLLNLFLDAVTEMFRVGKASVLLLDEGTSEYRIEVARGLHPELRETLKFSAGKGTPWWLRTRGKILRARDVREEAPGAPMLEIRRELEILQSAVSVPLSVEGRLIGFLNLGERVTGSPFADEELEMLFTLSSHVAVALNDIFLYQKVKYQSEFTESILVSMDSGLITIDERECVTVFNPRAEEVLERKAEEVVGKDLRVLPSPLGDMLYETLKTGRVYEKSEIEIKSPPFPLEVSTRQLLSPDGRPVGSLMLVADLRLRKDLEREKEKAARLELLDRVTAGIAHEIKNPLSSVKTCVQLLQEKHADNDFREFFRSTVTEGVDKMNNLIEGMVELTQSHELVLKEVDVHSILDDVIASLKKGKVPDNVVISTDFRADPSIVKVDRKRLSGALANIVLNGVEAMDDGGDLSISTGSEGDCIKISIADSGVGIPQGEMENIWDPLFSTKNRGVGLGLPIAQRIVGEHGGRVEVESHPKKGTTFHIYLPVP